MSTQPYAWTVKATVPADPKLMPKDRYGRPLWWSSSSSWYKNNVPGGVEGNPGFTSAKTWQRHSVAAAQATVARNCGFIVEIVPLFADDTDWKAKHDALAAEYAILELDMDELQREVVRLRTQLGEERITVLKLMKEAEAMSLYGSHEWTH